MEKQGELAYHPYRLIITCEKADNQGKGYVSVCFSNVIKKKKKKEDDEKVNLKEGQRKECV